MSDMGPRRMDGFAQPQVAGGRPTARSQAAMPVQQPAGRRAVGTPQPRPVQQRPIGQQRPVQSRLKQQRPVVGQRTSAPFPQPRNNASTSMRQSRPVQETEAEVPAKKQKRAKSPKGGGWKVVAQFLIGLAVIGVVAFAVVWLYIKYYQQ